MSQTHKRSDFGLDFSAPVQDIASLRAVGIDERVDKQVRLVEDKGAIYYFNVEGTGDDDGDGIIKPDDVSPTDPGRWFKMQGGVSDHQSLLNLQGGNSTDGERYHFTEAEHDDLISEGPTSREDRNMMFLSGASFTFNSTTGQLSWDDDVTIVSGLAKAGTSALAGSVTLAPGEIAFARINRPVVDSSWTMQVGDYLGDNDTDFWICVRIDVDVILFRNGIIANTSYPVRPFFPLMLDQVTNDAQLKRSAGDFDTFSEKTSPQDDDIVLIEDSASSFSKRKVKLSNVIENERNNIINLSATGLLTGGVLSVNSTNFQNLDVTDGFGLIVDNYSDVEDPIRTFVRWNDQTNIDLIYRLVAPATFIGVDSSGIIVQSTSPFTDVQKRDIIPLGGVSHQTHGNIESVGNAPNVAFDYGLQLTDFADAIGAFNIDGNVFGPNGANLKIDKNAGKTHQVGTGYSANKKSPNINIDDSISDVNFLYTYQNGTSGWVTTALTDLVDPENYDDGTGVLNSVPSGEWSIQAIFFTTQINLVVIQYGQATYATLNDAISAINQPFIVNPGLANSVFRGWLVAKQGCTELNDVAKAKFVSAGKFGLTTILNSGLVSGETNTASNVGVTGVGPYLQKLGVDLQFKNIAPASSKISVVNNVPNKAVDLDVVEANINHQSLNGAGLVNHSGLDSHVGSSSNPHSTTKSQVGLGSVTDDAQLKRSSGDFNSFANKATPVDADVLLAEDSAGSFAKVKMLVSNFLRSTAGYFNSFTEKTTPVSADILLIEDSASAFAKKKITFAGILGSLFGANYQSSTSEGESNTTNTGLQTKLTFTTPALTGTYRIELFAEIHSSGGTIFGGKIEAQLYDSTGAVELCFIAPMQGQTGYIPFTGIANIAFTGSAKTFLVRYRATSGSYAAYIRRVRVSIFKVSS